MNTYDNLIVIKGDAKRAAEFRERWLKHARDWEYEPEHGRLAGYSNGPIIGLILQNESRDWRDLEFKLSTQDIENDCCGGAEWEEFEIRDGEVRTVG